MMISLILIVTLVTFAPNLSHSLEILSCVDNLPSLPLSPWKSSVPYVKTQTTRSSANKSVETWYYEGASLTTGGDVILTYDDASLKTRGNNVKFYLEYLNDAPRRVSVEGVEGNTGAGNVGGLVLLPGDSNDRTNGWLDGLFQVSVKGNEKLKLTSFLKKPQRLYIRKLVVFLSPGSVTRSVTDTVKTKSCQELTELSSHTTTTRPGTSTGTSTQTRGVGTAPACKNKATATDGDSCSVCPECKCFCNCNCNKEGC